ncbi:Protein bark beetle [Eumeta japonica]|uniref:Protein bark beetle n=1 Tax=Eumeta variegata TaxID=151549 RepID=A0A4C1S8R2_EUMVA|nr:Protein bark beetle [Eumeta japonica]
MRKRKRVAGGNERKILRLSEEGGQRLYGRGGGSEPVKRLVRLCSTVARVAARYLVSTTPPLLRSAAMECCEDTGVQKRHSQFGDTKYKWRTVLLLVLASCSTCGGQDAEVDPYLVNTTSGLTELTGGILAGGQTTWRAESSPYLLRDDLLVERNAELVIEPGVEIRFAPMVGITVRGQLTAVRIVNQGHVLMKAAAVPHSKKGAGAAPLAPSNSLPILKLIASVETYIANSTLVFEKRSEPGYDEHLFRAAGSMNGLCMAPAPGSLDMHGL